MKKRSARRSAGAEPAPESVRELNAKLAAIERVQASIEFALDGTILDANENFLGVMGYRREEVVGKHHRMFVAPREAGSAEYARFWVPR
jgi:methyl-accepting chemotaxis protein